MEKNTTLNAFYYFSGMSGKDNASLVVNFDSNAAQHGQSLENPDASQPTGESVPTEPEEEKVPQITEPKAAVEQLGNIIFVGDRAMDVPYGDTTKIKNYVTFSIPLLFRVIGKGHAISLAMHFYKLNFAVKRSSYKTIKASKYDAIFTLATLLAVAGTVVLRIFFYIPI